MVQYDFIKVYAGETKQDVFGKHKCPQYWPIPKMANITRTNILIPIENRVTINDHLQNGSSDIYFLEVMAIVNLKKYRSNAKVKWLSTNRKILHVLQGIFM